MNLKMHELSVKSSLNLRYHNAYFLTYYFTTIIQFYSEKKLLIKKIRENYIYIYIYNFIFFSQLQHLKKVWKIENIVLIVFLKSLCNLIYDFASIFSL